MCSVCCSVCCSMLRCVLQCVSRCVSTSYLTTSGVIFFFLKVEFVCVAVCHDSFLCVTWIICMCTMTHIYVYHDSWIISVVLETWPSSKNKKSICMPGLIFVCVPHHSMTHIYVYNDSHLWVWRISYVCHDSHLSVECVMDQRFKDVISQQKNMIIWKRKRNSSSAYVFTHTHTHIHIRIRTRTHTYVHTFRLPQIESKSNQSKAGQITPNICTTGHLNSAETWEQLIQTLF
jgi:hypothetical protein